MSNVIMTVATNMIFNMTGYRLKRETVDIAPIASTGMITSVSRPHTGHTETMNLEARKWLLFSPTGSSQ